MEMPNNPNANDTDKIKDKNINDHLANERTFLAWVRTSIAIMGFGFVVVKFSVFMKRISLIMLQENTSSSTGHSGLIGVFLVILGVLVTGLALLNFFKTKKQIDSDHYLPSNRHIITLCIGIIVMGIALAWYLAESITTY